MAGWIETLPAHVPILDPACGEGALLLAALEALGGGTEAAGRLRGLELSPELAARTRARLARAAGGEPEDYEDRVLCVDALADHAPWPAEAAVVANPPWLSFSGRHAGEGTQPNSAGGWPSLQGAFLERIARHCATSATSARLLLPASLLELPRYAPAREAAWRHAHCAGTPVDLGEDAFPGVVEPSVLVELAPGERAPETPASRPPALAQLDSFAKLPASTFADPGVHTGNCGSELVEKGPRAGWAGLRRGADLAAYDLGPPSLSLRLDLERTPGRRFRIAPLERYREFPALLRQTAAQPVAALHTEPTYFRNSLLAVRHVPGLSAEFVVALLNSSVAAEWLRAHFRDARQRTFPQMKVGALRTLPTPLRARADNPELHDVVVRRVAALRPREAGFEGEVAALDALMRGAFGLGEAPTRSAPRGRSRRS